MNHYKRKIILCCIAKNEDEYIQEWLDYHFKLGFEHIVIYANDWNYYNTDDRITIINYPGFGVQQFAYNHFLNYFRNNFWWVGFWDVDEFLVLNKHTTLKKFLLDYDDYTCIAINWANFGSNGHKFVVNKNYNVLERFTKRSRARQSFFEYGKKNFLNSAVKCMRRYNHQGLMFVHEPEGIIHTLKKQPMRGPSNIDINYDVAQLNHYFIKSIGEMEKRILNGVPDVGRFKTREFYTLRDYYCNLVDDHKALNFMNENNLVLE